MRSLNLKLLSYFHPKHVTENLLMYERLCSNHRIYCKIYDRGRTAPPCFILPIPVHRWIIKLSSVYVRILETYQDEIVLPDLVIRIELWIL